MRCSLCLAIAILSWPAALLSQQNEPGFDGESMPRRKIRSQEAIAGEGKRVPYRSSDSRPDYSAETDDLESSERRSLQRFRPPIADSEPPQDENEGRRELPLRRAYQAPDIFRTPNPTPLESGVPAPNSPYAPRISPDFSHLPPVPQTPPETPMPPLAPLVNLRFSDTWLPAAKDDLGMNDFDLRGTLAMGRSGVFVTPGYGMHFLNGPTRTDLPAALYDAYVDVRWNKKLNEEWAFELAWTPSFFSDLENNTSDSFRFISTALAYYQLSPETQWMAGVMYLDRFDLNWFPIFGFIYAEPESDWRWEVVFPRPKFSRRVLRGEDKDSWAYLAGEFGGGAWAVQRTNGADDMIAYRDWRVTLGYETKVKDFSALSWFGEVGYVFNRQLEYRSGFGDFDPKSAGLMRLGVSY